MVTGFTGLLRRDIDIDAQEITVDVNLDLADDEVAIGGDQVGGIGSRLLARLLDDGSGVRGFLEVVAPPGIPVPTVPFVFNLANTIAALGPAGVFTSPVVQIDDPLSDSRGANILEAMAVLGGGASAGGTLAIEVSKDGILFFAQKIITLIADEAGFISECRLTGKFARAVLTNGAAASPTTILHADIRGS